MSAPASKLVLGTVQFGCEYGINSAGRPSRSSVGAILKLALQGGITILDTSSAYGDAESVLGSCGCGSFRIVSKYPAGGTDVEECFRGSLARLGRSRLDGYLLHHFSVWKDNPSVWDSFRKLRDKGLAGRIGFSLYSPSELEMLLDKGVDFNLLQFPRNLFDKSFDPYLQELHERGVEIHVRSTFLQGLFFMDRERLPEKLQPLRGDLLALDEALDGRNPAAFALGFNLQNPFIDGVLIGVDNESQLRQDFDAAAAGGPVVFEHEVKRTDLLNPVNWK